MKTSLHPTYHSVVVKCACGTTFNSGSTKDKIEVEICSACHPFFTGEMKFVDTMGRVEKFQAKVQAASGKIKKKDKKKAASDSPRPKTLKEMLLEKEPAAKSS